MSKLFWAILAVTVIALVGIVVVSNHKSGSNTSQTVQNPQEIRAEDHVEGNANAKVIFFEYGDLQCPACKAAFPLVQQLRNDYGNKIRFVFRHFPITSIHPHAFAGARAAEAAGLQNKFFQMHDLLYEKQDEWSSGTDPQKFFREYATQVGLNLDQFNTDYNSNQTTDRINADINIGKQINVSATPTFYIGKQKIDPNPRTYDELKAKIEAELAKNP